MDCPSSFTAEPWIATWLSIFGDTLKPSILVISSNGTPVGACIVSISTTHNYRLPLRTATLNATGEDDCATVYSECNGLVCRRDFELPVAQAIADYLGAGEWDNVSLRHFTSGACLDALRASFPGLSCIEQRRDTYYVDLRAIRATNTDYLGFLKPTIRKHVKQNLRYYSSRSPVSVRVAADPTEALAMFEQLAAYARLRWRNERSGCVFDAERFLAFHRTLIRDWFTRGAVQLLTISVGERAVGVIYNLVQGKRVYFYQCGYDYTDEKKLSPGTLSISLAIEYLLTTGVDDYDFLSGHADYKRRLSTGSREVVSATFRRPRLKFRVIDLLDRATARFHTHPRP